MFRHSYTRLTEVLLSALLAKGAIVIERDDTQASLYVVLHGVLVLSSRVRNGVRYICHSPAIDDLAEQAYLGPHSNQ